MKKKFVAKIFWRVRFYLQTDRKPYLTMKTETIDFKVAHLRNFDPFPKIPIYNHSFTSLHNLPVAPRSVLSFCYFAEATFQFQFFEILIFRGAHTNTSVPHAAILGSSNYLDIILFMQAKFLLDK